MPDAPVGALPPTRTVTVGQREVSYCELGDPLGLPVIAAHGSPGSRYQLVPLHEAAVAAGLRIIAPDRPGVGGTSPARERGFDSGGDDAIAVLDALGIDRAAALGFSGGAGYSLALALARPARVDRVVLACGMIPGVPRSALDGRIPIVSTLYLVARFAPRLATIMLEGRGPFARTRAANVDAWPAADRAIMADAEVQARIARMRWRDCARVRALRSTICVATPGASRSATCSSRCIWCTAPPTATCRSASRAGAQAQLPHATLRELDEQGHYFAVTRPETIIEALAAGR